MKIQKKGFYMWGMLGLLIALPDPASAISGCSTNSLRGIFDSQVSNLGIQSLLQQLNTPPDTASAAGLASNANSLVGKQLGVGRYYFDGVGNLVGVATVTGNARPYNTSIGKYTVNADCTGRINLSSGAAYDLVIVQGGRGAFYVRTDSGAGAGNLGTLSHAGSCANLPNGASYGFSFSGASSSDATKYGPYSAVGAITLLPGARFNLSESVYSGGSVTRSTASGGYTLGTDCTLALKFDSNTTAPPVTFAGILIDNAGGLLVLQPDKNGTLSGSLVSQ